MFLDQSPGTALDVATLAANPGPGSEPLRLWLQVLSSMQYMDTVSKRKIRAVCPLFGYTSICQVYPLFRMWCGAVVRGGKVKGRKEMKNEKRKELVLCPMPLKDVE